ncbi:MAG: autotransporter domain-containing protein, partial [Burkholderiales bacterium]
PYFAYLLSDAWGLDLLLGYGELDTRQSRTVGTGLLTTLPVNSEFASTRGFASTNLTYLRAWGNWKLISALGYTATKREQDGYVESGPSGSTVSASKQTVRQTSLLGEVAYGRGASEAYFGLLYEDSRNPQKVQFATGEQPANDPNSVLLSAGWRHFAKGLTANFAFSKRVAQDQVSEYGFSMMLRVDL